jgi:hypothetical protein
MGELTAGAVIHSSSPNTPARFNEIGLDGFAGIMSSFKMLPVAVQNSKEIADAHELVANKMAAAMKRAVVNQKPKKIRIRRKNSTPWDVKKGTYKRSIAAFKPEKERLPHTIWAGPRVGKKVPPTQDAWFANIVEMDRQYIEGNNRNAGAMTAVMAAKKPAMQRFLYRAYDKAMTKHVAALKMKNAGKS